MAKTISTVLLLAAIVGEQAPPSLAAFLIRHTVDRTRTDLARDITRKPVYVEMDSLRFSVESVGHVSVEARELMSELGGSYRAGRKSEVARCEPGPPEQASCAIHNDGLLIVLDSLRRTDDGYVAIISTHWSDRRLSSDRSALGVRCDEVVVERVNGGWQVRESRTRFRS